ncbi:CDP-6-deoxy-delta-3,4-glucoseen reductase [Pigmentiphaga sp. NML080357]|uniref:CDP-6-deoxy-delta-3,4-glucoseen reductase n=1 Tax=Pigmentiphaga sp. NML080357 TaxID=2008675 RepID=UPI000B41D3DB|nr:CDP-6-deoxy-delta-3,4-glucoseen reductase [Pigmentiphaga sp. NML080357]OVZ60628.1 CDP-6-deoxy-delta-3,4-glucoseen reductase [Pigmentiphaga sp. NML080357]
MSHTITLRPSGHTYTCPSDTPVLKAGLDTGLFLPYSCRSGVCRTCRGTILEGEVDYGDVHPSYLSEDDKRAGLALLCKATPRTDLVVEVKELDPGDAIRAKYLPARVLKMEKAADDVMIVTLGLPMNEPMLFRAGQYLDILRADGSRRSYSIANVPHNEGVRQVELHIRHMPGGPFTDHVFGSMKLREIHKLEMPLGSFFLRESDKPALMIASGTGFAPIKSLIEHSLQRGIRRPIVLYWGGRRRADLYLHDLAQSWAQQYDHIRFVPVLSEPTPACSWTGRTGFVHRAAMEDFPDMSGHQVYACGAPVVVESARRDYVARCGLPEDEFFADSFLTAREVGSP